MSDVKHATAFLVALGRLLEIASSETVDPDARSQTLDKLDSARTMLLRQHAFPAFTFQDGEVKYEGELLDDLRSWEWSLRLHEAGVGRLDITPGTTREDLEGFVDEVVSRLFLKAGGASLRELHGQSGVRFGELDIAEQEGEEILAPPLRMGLEAEAEAVSWLNAEVAEHGVVPAREASTIVRLLSVAMHSEREVVVPLVQLKTVDQYTTSHSINVSCLSMALAERLRYASVDVRSIGEAALLHDVGKTKIPLAVLNKKGKLTESEWKLIQGHTTEGAKILLASGPGMELAATVAYEHHIGFQGEGYPELVFPRQTHEASRLVQVCDVYDALRTRRPFRPPWPAKRAVEFLHEKSGTHLDPQFVEAFVGLIGEWEPRHVSLPEESDDVAA